MLAVITIKFETHFEHIPSFVNLLDRSRLELMGTGCDAWRRTVVARCRQAWEGGTGENSPLVTNQPANQKTDHDV